MNPHYSGKRFFILLAVLILAAVNLTTRTAIGSDEGWLPVDPSELALKSPMVEPDADAEAIFWHARVDDGGHHNLVISHYLRVKVFTKLGCEKLGKIDIEYGPNVKITDVAARMIAPNGSIAEVAHAEIVDREIVKANRHSLRATSFAFPRLEPGAIIEYRWKETISNASANGMRLQFQRNIPVQSISYHIKPDHSFGHLFRVIPFNMPTPLFEKEEDGFYVTTGKNMHAFHSEPFMPPDENVRSWAMINYTIASSSQAYTDLASRLYEWFQPLLKADDDIKLKSDEITKGAATPEEKLERIFAFCRANIRNATDINLGYSQDEVEKIKENKKPSETLKRGVGSASDIDLLFAALANAAGFDARVALLPDRGRVFFHRNLVVPGSLHASDIAIRVDGSWKFFNPGYHYQIPGTLRWEEEGVDALITDTNPVWTKTPLSPPDKSKETRVAKFQLTIDGTLEGDVTEEYTGHIAVERKETHEDDSLSECEETLKATLQARLGSAELTHVVIENMKDPEKPLMYRYHIRVPQYAQVTGKRIFFEPSFFEKGNGSPFTTSTRNYPIYFHYAWSQNDEVTISIPKGYAIGTLDAPKPVSAGRITRYSAKIELSDNRSTVVYSRSFLFAGDDRLLIPATSYADIKKLFDDVNSSDRTAIALTRGD